MRQKRVFAVSIAFGILVGACADPSGSGTADEANLTAEKRSKDLPADGIVSIGELHTRDVKACLATEHQALEKAVAEQDSLQAIPLAGDCIAKANDALLAVIEGNLEIVHSPFVGKPPSLFEAYRKASAVVCETLADAGPNAGGSLGQTHHAGCLRSREQSFGAILDAYFDITTSVPIPDDRAAHASCFNAHDAAIKKAPDDTSKEQAYAALAECVEQDASALSGEIAKAILNHFPDRPKAAVDAKVKSAFEASQKSAADLGKMMADASFLGGTERLDVLYGTRWHVAEAVVKITIGFTRP